MIVIHHTGLPPATPLREIAQSHRSDWPGILYDFVVDGQGEIFQTQPLDQAPDTPEPYVRHAVGVAFAGDFAAGGVPTTEQIAAGGRLLAWLLQRFPQLSWENVRGLAEVTQSESPGKEWASGRNWKQLLATATRRAGGAATETGVEEALRAQLAVLEQRLASTASAQEQQAAEKQALAGRDTPA